MSILQEDLYKGTQSLYYKRIKKHVSGYNSNYEPKSNKILVDIRRDHYDSQSYWRVCVWRDEWKMITSLTFDSAESSSVNPDADNPDINLFRKDADRLTKLALEILE